MEAVHDKDLASAREVYTELLAKETQGLKTALKTA
jgi:hypothetical protein